MIGSYNIVLSIARIAGIVLLLSLAVLLLYLTVRKIMNNKLRSRYNQQLQMLQGTDSALQVYLETGTIQRSLNREVTRHSPLFEALRVRLATSRSDLERTRIYEYARNHFHDYYARLLQKRRWSTRVNVLLELELFQMKSLQNELLALLAGQRLSQTEKFLLLRIFASFQMKELLPFLKADDAWLSESQLLQLLLPLQPPLMEILLNDFNMYSTRVQSSVIDALRLRNDRSGAVLALLESLLSTPDDALRLRALSALANFGYMSPEGEQKLLDALEHPEHGYSWMERQAQARLMGSIREEPYITFLQHMLGDESYQVRLTAADSLSRYKTGEDQLQRAVHHHPDRYAREMAAETLERKRYEGFFI
ncbi:hypothetical protein GCM10010912_03910 [Paenibacillus albidus]|uniref:HEAT repeat domain-containing protein n=1 Tax=Paenibacillus albidus TaxID=2041023 RepID=A0A917FBF7_9BACL|nr:HEAT repeat domain-containing protein [Paenibacillus albidus]GGF61979.1 hypothetical protein GCM10010912_03910 [Paenibacillus albidus]